MYKRVLLLITLLGLGLSLNRDVPLLLQVAPLPMAFGLLCFLIVHDLNEPPQPTIESLIDQARRDLITRTTAAVAINPPRIATWERQRC